MKKLLPFYLAHVVGCEQCFPALLVVQTARAPEGMYFFWLRVGRSTRIVYQLTIHQIHSNSLLLALSVWNLFGPTSDNLPLYTTLGNGMPFKSMVQLAARHLPNGQPSTENSHEGDS